MSEMIERVADAISEEYFGRLETRSPMHIEWCQKLARAAIQAMREPTEAMLMHIPYFQTRDERLDGWHDAIDEALK